MVGVSQSDISRIEQLRRVELTSFAEIGAMAAVLGYDLGANLYPVGDAIRDKGHQALIGRFRKVLSPAWRVAAEVPLLNRDDKRAWDLLLRIPMQLVGVEAETKIRDVQSFVRRIRERERDGGADVIVIVLAELAHNRRILPQLLEALGPNYATSARRALKSLREGKTLAGGAVVLI